LGVVRNAPPPFLSNTQLIAIFVTSTGSIFADCLSLAEQAARDVALLLNGFRIGVAIDLKAVSHPMATV
jgi:hypothetical protein